MLIETAALVTTLTALVTIVKPVAAEALMDLFRSVSPRIEALSKLKKRLVVGAIAVALTAIGTVVTFEVPTTLGELTLTTVDALLTAFAAMGLNHIRKPS